MGIVKVNKRYKKQLCADSANCRIIKHIIVMNQIGYRCEINQIIRGYRRYVILNHELEERKSNTIIIYARSLYRYIHTSFCANQISEQVLSVINDRKMLDKNTRVIFYFEFVLRIWRSETTVPSTCWPFQYKFIANWLLLNNIN